MNLLLLEDDADLGLALTEHLAMAGHQVQWCDCIADARGMPAPDMALLDLHLPDGDGLALLREWRVAGRRHPVIVLTARDQISDRIAGLRSGADDYLVKPFDLDELLARIDAVARRAMPGSAIGTGSAPHDPADRVEIDLDDREVRRGAERLALTAMEWAVLACLAGRPGRIFERGEIESRLFAQGLADSSSNSLEVIISRLRKKLGPGHISTHRGLGYCFDG